MRHNLIVVCPARPTIKRLIFSFPSSSPKLACSAGTQHDHRTPNQPYTSPISSIHTTPMTHLPTPSRTRSSLDRGLRSASDDVDQIFRLVLYRIEDGFDLVLDEVGRRALGDGRSSGVGGGLLFARGGLTCGWRGGVGARRRRIGSADGGGPGGTRLRGRGGSELRLVVRVDGHGHDLRLKVGVDQLVPPFYRQPSTRRKNTSPASQPSSHGLGLVPRCKTAPNSPSSTLTFSIPDKTSLIFSLPTISLALANIHPPHPCLKLFASLTTSTTSASISFSAALNLA